MLFINQIIWLPSEGFRFQSQACPLSIYS